MNVISVIIPVYNTRPGDLVRAIESVLQQSFPLFELLLIDDCSTSAETAEVLKRYQEHPRV